MTEGSSGMCPREVGRTRLRSQVEARSPSAGSGRERVGKGRRARKNGLREEDTGFILGIQGIRPTDGTVPHVPK